jgi:hypothetical protein
MQMTRVTFASWISPLRLAQVAREDGARRAVLLCPNTYVSEWCQYRLDPRIREALAGALHVPAGELDVQYVLEAGDGAD